MPLHSFSYLELNSNPDIFERKGNFRRVHVCAHARCTALLMQDSGDDSPRLPLGRDSLLGDAQRRLMPVSTPTPAELAELAQHRRKRGAGRACGVVNFKEGAVESFVSEYPPPTPTHVGPVNILTGTRTSRIASFPANAPGPDLPAVLSEDVQFPRGCWTSGSRSDSHYSPPEWNFDKWGFSALAWAYLEECHSPAFLNNDSHRLQRQHHACLDPRSGGGAWGAARAAATSFAAQYLPEALHVAVPADGSCAGHCLEFMPVDLRMDNAFAEVFSFTPPPSPPSAPTHFIIF